MSERVTQNKAIRKYLEENGRIDIADSICLFDCYRLAARIHDLRSVMKIETVRIPYINYKGVKKIGTEYRLVR